MADFSDFNETSFENTSYIDLVSLLNRSIRLNGSIPWTPVRADTFWQHRVAQALWLYLSPVIIIAGIVCNTISFVVLNTKSFRRSSLGFLLSALAVLDSVILLTPFLRHWIRSLTSRRIDVRKLSEGGCYVHMILTYMTPQLASWTLVLVSLERMASVVIPFTARELFAKKRTVLIWCGLASFFFLTNIHMIWTVSYTFPRFGDRPICLYKFNDENILYFWTKIWRWIDHLLMSIIPCIVIIVSNAITINALWKTRKIRRNSVASQAKSRQTNSTAFMLVAVSTVFVLTTTPSVGYYIYTDNFIDMGRLHRTNPLRAAQLGLAYAVTSMMYYLNNAVNFELYCISGTRFRQTLIDLTRRQSARDIRASRGSMATQFTRISRTSQEISEAAMKVAKHNRLKMSHIVLDSVAEAEMPSLCDDASDAPSKSVPSKM